MLSLVAMFAACDDSIWIEIRVPDGLAADEVELFLAVGHCEKSGEGCRGVRPWPGTASTVPFIPGTVFEHDTDVTFVAPVSDGSASFRLAASSDKLPALIAIGVTNISERPAVGGVVLGELDLSLGARHVIATLEPDDQDTRVFRWPDPADPARAQIGCAGVQHGTDPATFVVSPSDWDCDGFPNEAEVECNPLFYRASFAKESCAKPAPAGADGDACMLGDGSCQDGVGTTCTVDDPNFCVPQQLCDQCDFPDQGCLEDAFAKTPTHVSCTFPVVKEGGTHYSVCGLNNRAAAFADVAPPASVLGCAVAPLLTPALFAPDPPTPQITFSTEGQLAALKVIPIQPSPCHVTVELGGDLGLGYQPQRFPLHLHAGDATTRTLLVPLEISLREIDQLECDAGAVPQDCTVTYDEDTVLRCIRP